MTIPHLRNNLDSTRYLKNFPQSKWFPTTSSNEKATRSQARKYSHMVGRKSGQSLASGHWLKPSRVQFAGSSSGRFGFGMYPKSNTSFMSRVFLVSSRLNQPRALSFVRATVCFTSAGSAKNRWGSRQRREIKSGGISCPMIWKNPQSRQAALMWSTISCRFPFSLIKGIVNQWIMRGIIVQSEKTGMLPPEIMCERSRGHT